MERRGVGTAPAWKAGRQRKGLNPFLITHPVLKVDPLTIRDGRAVAQSDGLLPNDLQLREIQPGKISNRAAALGPQLLWPVIVLRLQPDFRLPPPSGTWRIRSIGGAGKLGGGGPLTAGTDQFQATSSS